MFWILLCGYLPNILQSLSVNECNPSYFNDPKCMDQPVGYYCHCGPGYRWNSIQCIAAGVDSKMVFQSVELSYTVLDRQFLPQEFTVSFWIRPRNSGVVFSLVQTEDISQITINLQPDMFNRKFSLIIRYLSIHWEIKSSVKIDKWTHIIWSQKIIDENSIKWIAYINFVYHEKTVFLSPTVIKGEFILGQLSKTFKSTSKDLGFAGDLAHFNIWNYSMSAVESREIYEDCYYNFCGNVVQWADFRHGIRGNLHLKWPSGLHVKPCADTMKLIRTCDSSCSHRIGAQCKVEIKANMEWERTKANTSVSNYCSMPPQLFVSSDNSSISIDSRKKVTRFCAETSSKLGKWHEPDVNECISDEWRVLQQKERELKEYANQCILSDGLLIEGLTLFVNLTEQFSLISANDLSLCVDILDVFTFLKVDQERKCPRFIIEISQKKEEIHQNQYTIIELVLKIASNLLDNKNLVSWNYTKPSGFEGRKLLGVLNKFYQTTTENINNLLNKYFFMPREMTRLFNYQNIIFKLKVYQWSEFKGAAFPDFDDINEVSEEWINSNKLATVALSNNFLMRKDHTQFTVNPNHVVIISAIYLDAALKAAHVIDQEHMKLRTGSTPTMSQRINGDIIDIAVSVDGRKMDQIKSQTLKINFRYKDIHNISNTNCLSMAGEFNQSNIYSNNRSTWINDCHLEHMKTHSVVCVCSKLGLFAIATDMFNDLWNKEKEPNNLIALPSYFGCTVSSMLCSISLVMLVYLRTSSTTSAIHKHFSMAIVAAQICYMFGIDKYEHPIICRIFSLSLHYFFFSCFTWLMNEAFNLYIVITYAAHSHGDSTDGHMWRFYLLGWIMPAILVAAVAGINKENYYAPNMCWINQKDIWLFAGPAIAVIAVSILVLIFTAKEHHESSYTKNEKDNKAIINQTKAIWTQIILLTLSWSFAFICVRMQGIIVKYLYGLFNSLQGAFYIVFYYLLNDEVQKIYSNRKNKERRRKVSEQVDDTLHDIPYVCYTDSYRDNEQPLDSNQTPESDGHRKGLSGKRRSFFSNVIENFNIRTRRSQSKEDIGDRSNNNNSDYELITSV